jgi:hypothetical protein
MKNTELKRYTKLFTYTVIAVLAVGANMAQADIAHLSNVRTFIDTNTSDLSTTRYDRRLYWDPVSGDLKFNTPGNWTGRNLVITMASVTSTDSRISSSTAQHISTSAPVGSHFYWTRATSGGGIDYFPVGTISYTGLRLKNDGMQYAGWMKWKRIEHGIELTDIAVERTPFLDIKAGCRKDAISRH